MYGLSLLLAALLADLTSKNRGLESLVTGIREEGFVDWHLRSA